MIYSEALKRLNEADEKEIVEKLAKLADKESFSEKKRKELLKETVGILFGAAKEYKGEELYRVIRGGNKIISAYEGLWEEESAFDNDFLTFYGDPITPFLEAKVKKDENANLLTYRKAVSENPVVLLLSGFPDDSGVFDVLQKDGLSDNGKQNYQRITHYIRQEIEKKDRSFLYELANVLTEGEPSDAFYYSLSDGSEYLGMKKDYIQDYYLCTSCIFCRLDFMEPAGDSVRIEPLMHNKAPMISGEDILYDDFGEIGCFTFEKNDYR